MQIENLRCGNCGAPTPAPAGVNFFTCNHCHSSLAVRRGESISYTEKIDEINARTQDIASELAKLRYESKLARLDRKWDQEREGYLFRNKNGQMVEPSGASSVIGGVLVVGFAVFWMIVATPLGGRLFFLFGLLFIALVVASTIVSFSKARLLGMAQRRYQQQREQLSATSSDRGDTDRQVAPSELAMPAVNDQVVDRLDHAQQKASG